MTFIIYKINIDLRYSKFDPFILRGLGISNNRTGIAGPAESESSQSAGQLRQKLKVKVNLVVSP